MINSDNSFFRTDGDFASSVQKAESDYERSLNLITSEICANDGVKLVAIAGPSSSGKTTSTKKLVKKLEMHGVNSCVISIDDFFFTPDASSLKMDGNTDFESLSNIDLDMLHECLHNLTRGMPAQIPVFDFVGKRRSDDTITLTPSENQIFLLEGLHALNPLIYSKAVSDERVYKIYLNTFMPDGSMAETARLMRRIVRDYHFRAASAEFTLYLWDSVMRGERENITPFVNLSNAKVNTYLRYEPSVMKPYLERILSEVGTDSKYYPKAESLLEYLSSVTPMSEKYVPDASLLREFIG